MREEREIQDLKRRLGETEDRLTHLESIIGRTVPVSLYTPPPTATIHKINEHLTDRPQPEEWR